MLLDYLKNIYYNASDLLNRLPYLYLRLVIALGAHRHAYWLTKQCGWRPIKLYMDGIIDSRMYFELTHLKIKREVAKEIARAIANHS